MDIYQKNIFNKGNMSFVSSNGEEKFEFGDEIVLYQNENYHIGGYALNIDNSNIEQISVSEKTVKPSSNGLISIPIDFEKPCIVLVVKFKNGVADDATISIKLNSSDCKAYDSKIEKENITALINKTALKISKGFNLINVMWHKASNSVDKVIVQIECKKDNESYIVYKEETEGEYLKIDSLAIGDYRVTIKQFDSKNKLIVETADSVSLHNPFSALSEKLDAVKVQVKASGKNIVSW